MSTMEDFRHLDQYSDNVSSHVWELCIGDHRTRTGHYRDFLIDLLRKHGCQRILDAACGTGVDSVLLLEEGFQVTSIDYSNSMLRLARDIRWERRKETAFDSWVIKDANWLTLAEDLKGEGPFDAIINIGISFPSLMDSWPEQTLQRRALKNLADMVKPGGIFIVDHLNVDSYLDGTGGVGHNFFYSGRGIKIGKVFMLYEDERPCAVKRNYEVDLSLLSEELADKYRKYDGKQFNTQIFPHRLADFKLLLRETFGESANYQVLGDFKPLDQLSGNPAIYVHVVCKSLQQE